MRTRLIDVFIINEIMAVDDIPREMIWLTDGNEQVNKWFESHGFKIDGRRGISGPRAHAYDPKHWRPSSEKYVPAPYDSLPTENLGGGEVFYIGSGVIAAYDPISAEAKKMYAEDLGPNPPEDGWHTLNKHVIEAVYGSLRQKFKGYKASLESYNTDYEFYDKMFFGADEKTACEVRPRRKSKVKA